MLENSLKNSFPIVAKPLCIGKDKTIKMIKT
jgi:hypothetical protein